MTKFNKCTGQKCKDALQTFLTDKPLENISAVKNVIYATPPEITNVKIYKPAWKAKLKLYIEKIRCEFSILEEISRNLKVSTWKSRKVKPKCNIKEANAISLIKEILQRNAKRNGAEDRGSEKRCRFYRQNTSQADFKTFYREIGKKIYNSKSHHLLKKGKHLE